MPHANLDRKCERKDKRKWGGGEKDVSGRRGGVMGAWLIIDNFTRKSLPVFFRIKVLVDRSTWKNQGWKV